MARRPPSHPKQAWEEVRAPQESSSPAEPYEVTTVQPLQMSKTLEEEENAQHPDVQPKGQSESPRLFPLPHSSVVTTGWVDLHVLQAHLKHPSPAKNFLALRALVALSEEEEMARRMRYRCLLDDILLCLRNPYADSRVSALLIFHNLMGHLKKKSRAIALLLVDELPPFFDDESIQVQELSISLLRKMVESVEGGDELEREEMKKKIWRALLPLLFHLNDQTDSVAQATQEALLTCADFLDNEKLKRRVKRKDTRKIGKLLLEQDKRRLPDHLNFCMKSMADTRASVRLQAVRFMGIAVRRLSGTQDQESLWKMCSALHRLEKDPDLEVRSQAAETLVFLRSLLKKGSLGWFRWVLCCWL